MGTQLNKTRCNYKTNKEGYILKNIDLEKDLIQHLIYANCYTTSFNSLIMSVLDLILRYVNKICEAKK